MTTNKITVRAIVSADKQKTRKASPREQLKPIFPREFFSYFETYRTLSLNKEIPFPFPLRGKCPKGDRGQERGRG